LIVVPISKPTSEAYAAAENPVLSHETDAIETPAPRVQAPLLFDAIPAQQIADASPQVAQGDAAGGPDVPEVGATQSVVTVQPIPAPTKTVRTIAVPATPVLANLQAHTTLASNDTVKGWAVQIGAFASETLARAKLAVFARSGFDIIGQAQKLVVPFMSGGRIMYRARLGTFAEGQARDICRRMEQRGQSCFVAPADAG
jgi:D-alanyl-D-alanine carboxypeptidase